MGDRVFAKLFRFIWHSGPLCLLGSFVACLTRMVFTNGAPDRYNRVFSNGLRENQDSCTATDSLELGIKKKVRVVHFRALILAERIAILTNFTSNGQWLWSLFVNMIPINSSITSARSIPFIIVLLFII